MQKIKTMKKIITIVSILTISWNLQNAQAQNKEKVPYFYEVISNPDKSVDYAFGVYPTRSEYVRNSNGGGYTKMRVAVINYSKQDLKWNDYKVYILMKNGDLFYNYTTAAKDGELNCNYVVKPNETHIQYVCFEKDFDVNQIDRIYLSLLDNKFFPLIYTDGSDSK